MKSMKVFKESNLGWAENQAGVILNYNLVNVPDDLLRRLNVVDLEILNLEGTVLVVFVLD